MDWGTDLWDQYDGIDKHTQSGLDLVDRYVKFVRERTEIEQNYAKQLRNLSKKYLKRGSKEEQECGFTNHQSFQDIVNELNDYAGQRELIAENMMTGICVELTKYLQDLKQERKTYLADAKKAQQNLEISFKQLENTKRRFAKEWGEAEKATQQAEKIENDTNAMKADVEKVKQHAHVKTHTAEECRNDYAAQLQKYNKEQNTFYYTEIPQLFNKLQDMDERRIRCLAEGYSQFAEVEKKVLPIITKCLDGISMAGRNTNGKQDSLRFIEQHKSGFERPAEVDFEDYSQGIKPASSDCLPLLLQWFSPFPPCLPPFPRPSLPRSHTPLSLPPPPNPFPLSKLGHAPLSFCLREFNRSVKPRLATFRALHRPSPAAEDFSHLPPEQRKKRLQSKIDDITKELQKELDQSEALEKMRGVYERNPQMGDPASLEPQITQTSQNVGRLRGQLTKYELWLAEAFRGDDSTNTAVNNNQHCSMSADPSQNIYSEFDEDFDEDVETPIGKATALYTFQGSSQGTVSITEGEQLSVMENDKGDGWMRVLRANGDEGYIPSSYVKF
uniref:Thyroid hormone receptor interactor 10 n=1 Tax=Oncorhynchus mykiss TaxID=8022 RepID=A0A8K9UI29_ONCMY